MEAGIFYEGVDSQIAAQGKQSVYLQGVRQRCSSEADGAF